MHIHSILWYMNYAICIFICIFYIPNCLIMLAFVECIIVLCYSLLT